MYHSPFNAEPEKVARRPLNADCRRSMSSTIRSYWSSGRVWKLSHNKEQDEGEYITTPTHISQLGLGYAYVPGYQSMMQHMLCDRHHARSLWPQPNILSAFASPSVKLLFSHPPETFRPLMLHMIFQRYHWGVAVFVCGQFLHMYCRQPYAYIWARVGQTGERAAAFSSLTSPSWN